VIARRGGRRVFPDGSSWPLSPFSLFWLIEDQAEFPGALLLRRELANDLARLFGGHIRYGIRPSRLNEGIGTELLMAGLTEARGLGLGRVLVTCGETNLPSRRLIEKCGGTFAKTVRRPGDSGLIRRYWMVL
jgi:predicted acetyltransferase